MKFRNYFLGFLIVIISSCKKSESYSDNEIIDTENYSIRVPTDFERTTNLNELAKVQFQKVDEDLYFIILEETKKGFIDAIKLKVYDASPSLFGYFKVITNHFDEITENFEVKDFSNTKINSCNAIIFSMSGTDLADGTSAFYRYAIFEDDNNLYQIMSWTNNKNKNKLIGRMEGIINSFKSKKKSK